MKHALVPSLLCAALVCAGCASSGVEKVRDLQVASRLEPLPQGASGYQYIDPKQDFSGYRRVLIEPTVLYGGSDHGFGDTPAAERTALARRIDAHAARILGGGKVTLADAPGPDVLRLRLTLVGMSRSRALLQGVSYVIPVGAALNLAKGASGGSGTFMGAVTLAGEFHDSRNGALLAGFLAARGPGAFDVSVLSSDYAAAEQGAVLVLEDLRRRFDARALQWR